MIIDILKNYSPEKLEMFRGLRALLDEIEAPLQRHRHPDEEYDEYWDPRELMYRSFGFEFYEEMTTLEDTIQMLNDKYINRGWVDVTRGGTSIYHMKYLNENNIPYVAVRQFEYYDTYKIFLKNDHQNTLINSIFRLKSSWDLDFDAVNEAFEKAEWITVSIKEALDSYSYSRFLCFMYTDNVLERPTYGHRDAVTIWAKRKAIPWMSYYHWDRHDPEDNVFYFEKQSDADMFLSSIRDYKAEEIEKKLKR